MKHAFTMLELVFVIVLIGIISVLAIPRFDDNNLRQAADQLVGHIRYTQHLAMIDDKFRESGDATWYRKRWQVVFNSDNNTNNQWAYTIFSDGNENANPNLTLDEVALNPSDPNKFLTGGYTGIIASDGTGATQEMNLGMTYGVQTIGFTGSCQFNLSQRISFDYLGRPLRGVPSGFNAIYQQNRLITNQCVITLTDANGANVQIAVEPETGYTHIL